MDTKKRAMLLHALAEYVTPEKQKKMDEVLALRTRYITPVLEDVFQPHNASAIIRSTECFGVQEVHCVQDKYRFNVNQGVARGAAYWMNIRSHASMQSCIASLKEQGYRIVATTPHTDAYDLHDLPIDQKTALLFGTELTGLSEYSMANADTFVKIPMVGFTESFNVSVSVALCLYDVTQRLRRSSIKWQLTDEEKEDIRLQWYKRIVRASEQIERQLLE